MNAVTVEPLTAASFAPFGEVIEAGGPGEPANQGTATRYRELIQLDTAADGGHTAVGLFRAEPSREPVELRLLERHPLGSQAFVPMNAGRYLVVVASGDDAPRLDGMRAFLADGLQGVNYRRGVWHHPLLTLDHVTDFLVIDRAGPGDNCEEHPLRRRIRLAL